MRPNRLFPALATALTASIAAWLPGPVHAQRPQPLLPTPELRYLIEIDLPGAVAFVAGARLGTTRTALGLSLICRPPPARKVQITAHFGGFPADRRPVQLALRKPDGSVLRFGPAVRAGPSSGFHSPRLTDPRKARRFVAAALQHGTLVSNGYRSFWNRIPEPENRRVQKALLPCLEPQPK